MTYDPGLVADETSREVDELYRRELVHMGAGDDHELIQVTPLEGGGWCLVYDYTSNYEVDGKVMRQRRCAIYGPGNKQAAGVILSTAWVAPAGREETT